MDATRIFQNMTPIFTALGDPLRQQIVMELAGKPRGVNELAKLLSLSQPAVSHHLKIMQQAKLVAVERRGTSRIYSLTLLEGVSAMKTLIQAIEALCVKENM